MATARARTSGRWPLRWRVTPAQCEALHEAPAEVVLDELPELGFFLEIEAKDEATVESLVTTAKKAV